MDFVLFGFLLSEEVAGGGGDSNPLHMVVHDQLNFCNESLCEGRIDLITDKERCAVSSMGVASLGVMWVRWCLIGQARDVGVDLG